MTGFGLDAGDGVRLVLYEQHFAEAMFEVILANQARLAQWELWATFELDLDGHRARIASRLEEFTTGAGIPLCIEVGGELAGSINARVDDYSGSAEIGYWIAASHEGRGIVVRSAQCLIDHLIDDRELARIEIRTAFDNQRSRRLAERLGFTHEGTLRSSMPMGDHRVDDAVYGLLPDERPWRAGAGARPDPAAIV